MIGNIENMCPQPFSGLILNQDGGVSVCRMLPRSIVVGNIQENTLEEIWNSQKITSWRDDFKNGIPKCCKSSISEFNCHKTSPGHKALNKISWQSNQIDGPQRITFNLTGSCNLSCPMCETKVLPRGPYPDNVLELLPPKWIHQLRYVDFYGGEPFILSETFKIVIGIMKKNTSILWSFTTNGNWDFNRILPNINNIKIFSIHFSVDSLNERNYAILRKDGCLKLLLQNIDKMIDFKMNNYQFENTFNIEVSLTVQKENWSEIFTFIKWARGKNVIPLIQLLKAPAERSIYNLPTDEKMKIIKYCYIGLKKYYPHINPVLRSIINSLPLPELQINRLHYLDFLVNLKK